MAKKIIIVSAVVGLAVLGALTAFAQTTYTTPPATAPTPATTAITAPPVAIGTTAAAQQMVVQIGPNGETLLRGTVDSMGTGTITVKSWGGDWTINIPSTAQVLPATTNGSTSQFATGDFIGVQGTASTTASWTIDATLVRDWTLGASTLSQRQQTKSQGQGGPEMMQPGVQGQGVQAQINAILQQIQKIQQQISSQPPAAQTQTQPVPQTAPAATNQ